MQLEGNETHYFGPRLSESPDVGATHEPQNAFVDFQWFMHFRFMAPTHVRFLEVSALHEPWLPEWGARRSRLHRSASRRPKTTWGTATRVRRDARAPHRSFRFRATMHAPPLDGFLSTMGDLRSGKSFLETMEQARRGHSAFPRQLRRRSLRRSKCEAAGLTCGKSRKS